MTTPSALSTVASQHFLDAQPPLLSQEGTTFSKTRIEAETETPSGKKQSGSLLLETMQVGNLEKQPAADGGVIEHVALFEE